MTLAEAQNHCTALARRHYENFPVGTLVPAHLQAHVHAIYAFARYADDFADEGYEPGVPVPEGQPRSEEERLAALESWERQLLEPAPVHPVFVALRHTRRELDLPVTLFTDLLSAFKQDVVKRRYADFAEVLDYCRRSANPIGRLVLLVHGQRDERLLQWSDAICTGLQLANFWQDVAVDLKKDRIYLPVDDRARFGVREEQLFRHEADEAFCGLMRFQTERARDFFTQGEPLARALPGKLSWEIRFTWLGGVTILNRIVALGYDTLHTRPKLSRWDFLCLGLQALFFRGRR